MIITVDGLIGAGKSTVMETLRTEYDYQLDLEQVDKWAPYLKELYYDNKGAFEFQMRIWLDRCFPVDPGKNQLLFVERSPLFQSEVFVNVNEQNGMLSIREAGILREVYKTSLITWKPICHIYLQADPVKCLYRIKQRNRESEDTIKLEYLQLMHKLHEDVYEKYGTSDNIICINVENKTPSEISLEVKNKVVEYIINTYLRLDKIINFTNKSSSL